MHGGDTQQDHMWSYIQPEQPAPSLKPLGRAARSRGRTSPGESHGIHGILPGTFLIKTMDNTRAKTGRSQ